MHFDDLEAAEDPPVSESRKTQQQSSQVGITEAADNKGSQNRAMFPSVEAEAPVKKQRGRRPGSGYVKDRWYYVPF
jgi:hypothetical protein